MSQRRILTPKTRRGRGGGDLSALGNPFAPVDPNIAGGSKPPNDTNTINSLNNTQSQSFPPNGSNNPSLLSQNSLFPPTSQQKEGNIFGSLNGGKANFTFASGFGTNPYSEAQTSSQKLSTSTSNTQTNPFSNSSQPSHQSSTQNIFNFGSPSNGESRPNLTASNNIFGAAAHNSLSSSGQSVSLFGSAAPPAQQPNSNTATQLFGGVSEPSQSTTSDTSAKFLKRASEVTQQISGSNNNNIFGIPNQQSQLPQTPSQSPSKFTSNQISFARSGDNKTSSDSTLKALNTSPADTDMSSPPNQGTSSPFKSLNSQTIKPPDFNVSQPASTPLSTISQPKSSSTSAPAPPFNPFPNTASSAPTSSAAPKTLFSTSASANLFANTDPSTPVSNSTPKTLFGTSVTSHGLDQDPGKRCAKAHLSSSGDFLAKTDQAQPHHAKPSSSSTPNLFSAHEQTSSIQPANEIAQQSQPSQSNLPPLSSPGQIPPETSTDSINNQQTSTDPTAAKPLLQREELKKLNSYMVEMFQNIFDHEANWSAYIHKIADAYQSEAQRITGKAFNRDGNECDLATFGIKRKDQADPPENAPRPQKQQQRSTERVPPAISQNSGNSSLSDASQSQSHAPTSDTISQPPTLGTGSNKKRKATEDPEGAPHKHNQTSASNSMLFPPGQSSPSTSTMFGGTSSGNSAFSSTPNPMSGFNTYESPKPALGLFQSSAKSSTPNLFQSATKPSAPNLQPDQSQPGLFFGAKAPSTQLGVSDTSSNIFGHVTPDPSTSKQDAEEEESEDEGIVEDDVQNESTNPNIGKSLFDRITRDPPIENVGHSRSPKNPFVESGDEGDGEMNNDAESTPQSSAGDHTWKPNDQIKFGDSLNTPSKVNGTGHGPSSVDIFGQSQNQGRPLFGQSQAQESPFGKAQTQTNLLFGKSETHGTPSFQSNVIGATPESSPAKSFGNMFSFGLKPAGAGANSLSVSNATSAGTSRATTPGTEVNGVSASEDNGEGPEGDSNVGESNKVDLTDLSPDEKQNEDILFEASRAKIMQFTKADDDEEASWKVRGTGPLRVLKHKENGIIRILHRIAPRGTVLINSAVMNETSAKKAQKGVVMFGAMGVDEDNQTKFQRWTARFASDTVADECAKCLKENAPE